jgi:hypothetical protein
MNTISSDAITKIHLILSEPEQINSIPEFELLYMGSDRLTDAKLLKICQEIDICRPILLALLEFIKEVSFINLKKCDSLHLAYE